LRKRAWRIVFFTLAIAVGVAAGLGYGWAINPWESTDTHPHTLRMDYQTDIVLMIAELYHAEEDTTSALARLSFLGDTPPLEMVNAAIAFADELDYAPADLQLMLELEQAMEDVSRIND
jgi:hypothetical protein